MNRLWWVIIGLAAVIVLMILFDRDPEPVSTQKWKDTISRKEEQIKVLQDNLTTIRLKVTEDSLESIKSKLEHDSKVKVLNSTVAKLKANPIVIKVREETPEVDSLIVAQDSTIEVQTVRIQTLEFQYDKLEINMDAVVQNFQEQIKLHEQKFQASQEMNKELEKDIKKQKRGKRWLKAGAVAGTIAGFVLGSQL